MLIYLISKVAKYFSNEIKASSRDQLYQRGDWQYIYNNSDILEYLVSEADKLINSIEQNIIRTRDRALSILNYLFLTLGGLLYLFFYKSEVILSLNSNVILGACIYFTFIILFLVIYCIVPSKARIRVGHLEPVNIIPSSNNLQNLLEIKIEKLLAMQQAIQENDYFSQILRDKLFFSVVEKAIIIVLLSFYFLLSSLGLV